MYAWIGNVGIHQTEDGGASWQKVPEVPIADPQVYSLVHSPLPGSMKTGWRPMDSLPINIFIRSVAVDTVNPKRIYAAGPAGLFRSNDAGQTWQAADEELTDEPLAVVLDPAAPQTVFTVLTDDSVWRSSDGAITWQPAE